MIESKSVSPEFYADFSGFESMRRAARENSPEAVQAVAKQLEGMFLNMMLSSMREANQLFSEDSLFSSKDVRFYQQMLDQQLSTSLSEGKGMGIANEMAKQLTTINQRHVDPGEFVGNSGDKTLATPPTTAYLLKSYQQTAIPVAPAQISKADDKPTVPGESVLPDNPYDKPHSIEAVQPSPVTGFEPISPQDFVDKIVPYAQKTADELGIPVESIVAQAALETGWGRYMMKHDDGQHALNFFGIKAGSDWQGNTVDVMTVEYRNGIAAKETASFRSYDSLQQAFSDYADFLQQKPRYQQALQSIRENNDAKTWGNFLQDAGYATDPNYGKKIASIVSRLQKDGAFQTHLNVSQASSQ